MNTLILYVFIGVVTFLVAGVLLSLFSKKADKASKQRETKVEKVYALAIWTHNSEVPYSIAFLDEISRDKAFDQVRATITNNEATYSFSNNVDGTYCFVVPKHVVAVHKMTTPKHEDVKG